MMAAYYGKDQCVKVLANEEAELVDDDGRTALMYAARNGMKKCVEALMKK